MPSETPPMRFASCRFGLGSGGYPQANGYSVLVARNGHESLAAVARERVDAVVMDIEMPELDGLETIRQLRADPASVRIPIIALTALAMPEDRVRCLAAGATGYITKPTDFQSLVETIEKLINTARESVPCRDQSPS